MSVREGLIVTLPESEGGFTHSEYRSYEAIVTRGIESSRRRGAAEGVGGIGGGGNIFRHIPMFSRLLIEGPIRIPH